MLIFFAQVRRCNVFLIHRNPTDFTILTAKKIKVIHTLLQSSIVHFPRNSISLLNCSNKYSRRSNDDILTYSNKAYFSTDFCNLSLDYLLDLNDRAVFAIVPSFFLNYRICLSKKLNFYLSSVVTP